VNNPLPHNPLPLLLNLLARIHRDGGHYTAEHGLDKSTEDAEKIVVGMMAQGDELKCVKALASGPGRDYISRASVKPLVAALESAHASLAYTVVMQGDHFDLSRSLCSDALTRARELGL
jgi:hypothetical protein